MKITNESHRAKRIIVELVRQAGGKFWKRTNLFKAFWRAHLAYADVNHGYLSSWPIVRMPNGPGIDGFDGLLQQMIADEWLIEEIRQTAKGPASVFSLGQHPPKERFSQVAIEAIQAGVAAVDGKSADAVSDESHNDSRVWNEGKDGDRLNIYLDLVEDTERDEREIRMRALAKAFDEAITSRQGSGP